MFDVVSLLDYFHGCDKVIDTYKAIVAAEIAYRGINVDYKDCLKDTFEAALCIASRGKVHSSEYPTYVKGIRDLRGHIYAENYSPEIAAVRAVKVMYVTMCLLIGYEYTRVDNANAFSEAKITHKELESLKYLRKVNLEAYAYLVLLDEIYTEYS